MSSMRNAVQRRNHRERGQPEERKKWGLLEKHKDYSARAKDFNAKKAKLKALKQKVLEKNPDEFYYGMMSRKGPSTTGKNRTGTVNGDRGNEVMSVETVRLLKTQDLGYVRTARNKAAKEVMGLERRVKGISGSGKKIVFVDEEVVENGGLMVDDVEEEDEEDDDNDLYDLEGLDDTDDEEVEEKSTETPEQRKLRRQQKKEAEKLEARLEQAQERLKSLTQAEEALDLQRAKMAKSMSVGGINKHGVKFKVRERKR